MTDSDVGATSLASPHIGLSSALAEAIPQLVWSTRPDGSCDYFNGRWYAYTGATLEEHRGSGWLKALHPEDVERAAFCWAAAMESGEPYEVEYRIRGADGAYRWFLARGLPIKDDAGHVTRWFGTCTDIDQQVRTRENERFLSDLHERLRKSSDPQEVMWIAVSAVGEFLGVSRATYAEVDYVAGIVTVTKDYCRNVPSVSGTYPVADFAQDTMADVKEGRTVVCCDAEHDPRTFARYEGFYRPLLINAFVAVPVMKEETLSLILTVQCDTPRNWTRNEVTLLETLAERTWLAVRNARLERAAREHMEAREEAEEARRISEERLRAIFDQASVGIVETDLEGRLTMVNRRYCEIVGRPPEVLLQMHVQELNHPDDAPINEPAYANIYATGEPFEIEKRYVRPDGTEVWVHSNVSMVSGPDGEPRHFIGIVQDVTDRRKTEEALRDNETLYRTLGEAVPDFVWVYSSLEGGIYANKRYADYVGMTQEELLRTPVEVTHHPDDLPGLRQVWADVAAKGLPFEMEFRLRRHDGEYRWFLARAVPIKDDDGSAVQWVGTSTDIHERKIAVEALRKREQELLFITKNAPALISNVSTDYQFRYVNPPYAERFGITADDVIGKRVWDVIGQEAFEAIRPYMLRAFAGEEVSYIIDVPYRQIGVRRMQCAYAPYRDDSGKVGGLVGIIQDTTELARTETALRASEERYRTIVETTHEGVWVVDCDYKTTFVNARMAEMLGYAPDEMIGRMVMEFMDQEERATFAARRAERKAGQRGNYDSHYRRKDGSDLWVIVSAAPIQEVDGSFAGAVAMMTDITERKASEQALKRHQREIEALNKRLQRAMAETHHRVKNNLQVIAAMVDLQVMQDTPTLPVGEVKRLGSHVRTLAAVHDLLTERAKSDAVAERVSAQAVMEKLLPLLQQTLRHRDLNVRLQDAQITARQGTGLALVTNELVSNAVKHGRGSVEVCLKTADDVIELVVSDDGPGFPPDFDQSSAETTGLMLVENLSQWDLGGTVQYENRAEGGARVIVRFPADPSSSLHTALPPRLVES